MQLDMVSNNLANSATVGYKPEKSFFSVYNKAKADGRGLPLTPFVNDGTVVAQSGVDFSQGAMKTTGRSLDLAIEGNGFFMVQTPKGVQATRDGRFQIGTNGQLQALDGSPLLGPKSWMICAPSPSPARSSAPGPTATTPPAPRPPPPPVRSPRAPWSRAAWTSPPA